MKKQRKGAVNMTDVLANVEYIVENYENEQLEKDFKNTKVEFIYLVFKLRRFVKTEFAQEIIKRNIIKDKTINEGRYTIKGTRITPEDIDEIIGRKEGITIDDIHKEFPTLENDEQILAGIIFSLQKNLKWSKVLFEI